MTWEKLFFFFFSSRRRHTRFKCDWSSDVCSSDLYAAGVVRGGGALCARAAAARRGRGLSRVMDLLLVVNAGSSSLKFCVYSIAEAPTPALVSRGQVDGIGTHPRLRARDDGGATLADQTFAPRSEERRVGKEC